MSSTDILAVSSLVLFMFGMGCDTKLKDFAPILSQPRAALAGLFAQVFGLPIVAVGVISIVNLDPLFEFGILIISFCPSGPSSNLFTWLAKGDIALSVALTAASSSISVITIPLFISVAANYFSLETAQVEIDAIQILSRLFVLCLFPFICGMTLLRFFPKIATSLCGPLRNLGVLLLVTLVATIGYHSYDRLIASPLALLMSIVMLIAGSSALAHVVAKSFTLSEPQRRTIIIEVVIQNAVQGMAVATMISSEHAQTLALPATIYAVFMYLGAGLLTALVRKRDRLVSAAQLQ
jgi:BASS family bile acid:Na+ symporter